ncbi:hypothetical protein BJ986_002314 [Phycicoccus badiiscoriae]|uniref:Uncharacterized protein n=1 Tax=Pedococcus badiiscoriae TaxID=642776 RepID=A0A852WF21_9MICO|nr:hypothetical protein [Pedococcus badiiscoriae]NYG07827.1 hypothetical protein [Pedococcus badiiscoriae]
MTTKRRAGATETSHEGEDALAGRHVRPGTRRARAREDALAAAQEVERVPGTADQPLDRGTPMSDSDLDQRDRQQSSQRKKPGPKPPETPHATPVEPAASAPPPTDPE